MVMMSIQWWTTHQFKMGEWNPKNVQRTYYGKVPLQEVLNKSLNAATARLLYEKVKLPTAAEYARAIGYGTGSQR